MESSWTTFFRKSLPDFFLSVVFRLTRWPMAANERRPPSAADSVSEPPRTRGASEGDEFHLWEEETVYGCLVWQMGGPPGGRYLFQPAIFPGVRTRADSFRRVIGQRGASVSSDSVHEQQNFVFRSPTSFWLRKQSQSVGLCFSGGATSRQRDGFAGAVPAGAEPACGGVAMRSQRHAAANEHGDTGSGLCLQRPLAVATFHGGPPPCEQVNPRSRWRPDQRAGPWQGPKAQGVGYKNKSGGRGRVAATFCGGQRPPERQRGRCRVPLVEQKGVLCDTPGGVCEPSSANERIKPLLFQPQNIRRMQCGLQGRLRRRIARRYFLGAVGDPRA